MIADTQSSRALAVRRALLVGPSLVLMIVLAVLAGQVFAAGPRGPLDAILLGLFVLVMSWECFVVWQLCLGFASWLAGPRTLTDLERRAAEIELVATGLSRTAVLIPVYDEDADAVFAGVRVMARSIRATGAVDDIDIHVLSDTRDPDVAAAEERAYAAFSSWAAEGGTPYPRVHYRRRAQNVGRKAGNIAEWMERCGDAYDFMIVLDADSLLSGDTMVRLAALMEANPRTGLIQTHIVPAGRETLFARALQFSSRMTGVVLSMGNSFWQNSEANYFGHNAILRVAAFAECCRLPVLSGRPPLGGEILSHDFVEAAFLRRGGWYCWLLPELRGSYEELPSNLLDYAVRDRRWMQGNLQHARLISQRGLHWMSRLHFGMGIFAYVASPLWLAMLMLSSAMVVDHRITGDIYFGPTRSLFPLWPQYHWPEIHGLLGMTLALLLGPKLLALTLRLWSTRGARRFGGRLAMTTSFLVETAFSTLLAPVMMLFHTTFLIRILAGNAVGWPPQARGDRGMDWRQALQRHIGHVLFGVGSVRTWSTVTRTTFWLNLAWTCTATVACG